MEQKESNAIVVNGGGKKKMKIKDQQGTPKPMKKRGAMHFFRVALYMLRRKSKKSMHVDLASKVLVSMRPLNLQAGDDNNNNQPRLEAASKDIEDAPLAPPLIEQATTTEEVFTPPVSPMASKSIASSSSTESLSQYASALNLRDLDTCEEGEEEEDEEHDDNGGDEMIDAKAEEFINQFYEQMRIQNFEYMKSHNARE